jgi:hypothetical protein
MGVAHYVTPSAMSSQLGKEKFDLLRFRGRYTFAADARADDGSSAFL